MPPMAAITGQQHPVAARQFAFDDLALDFETNEQKENRHQPVVHPKQQRLR